MNRYLPTVILASFCSLVLGLESSAYWLDPLSSQGKVPSKDLEFNLTLPAEDGRSMNDSTIHLMGKIESNGYDQAFVYHPSTFGIQNDFFRLNVGNSGALSISIAFDIKPTAFEAENIPHKLSEIRSNYAKVLEKLFLADHQLKFKMEKSQCDRPEHSVYIKTQVFCSSDVKDLKVLNPKTHEWISVGYLADLLSIAEYSVLKEKRVATAEIKKKIESDCKDLKLQMASMFDAVEGAVIRFGEPLGGGRTSPPDNQSKQKFFCERSKFQLDVLSNIKEISKKVDPIIDVLATDDSSAVTADTEAVSSGEKRTVDSKGLVRNDHKQPTTSSARETQQGMN